MTEVKVANLVANSLSESSVYAKMCQIHIYLIFILGASTYDDKPSYSAVI